MLKNVKKCNWISGEFFHLLLRINKCDIYAVHVIIIEIFFASFNNDIVLKPSIQINKFLKFIIIIIGLYN